MKYLSIILLLFSQVLFSQRPLHESLLTKGSYLNNITKVAATENTSFLRLNKGLCLIIDNTEAITWSETYTGIKTIVFSIYKTADTKLFIDNITDKLEINGGNVSGVGLTENYVNNVNTDAVTSNQWQHVVSEFSGGISFATNLKISSTSDIKLSHKILLFDRILASQERNKLYQDFLNAPSLGETKFNYHYEPPRDLSYFGGLVAAYNFTPSGGKILSDLSGNGYSGDIYGALGWKEGMRFDGVDDYVDLGNLGNIKSVYMVIKVATTTENIIQGQSNNNEIYVNAGTLTYPDFDNAFINGVDNNTMAADVWNDVVVTSTTNTSFSAADIGLINTTYGEFEIKELYLFDQELGLNGSIYYYNLWAKDPVIKETFKYGPVGETLPLGWLPNYTGSWVIAEISNSDDTGLTPIGMKYYRCSSAGIANLPIDLDSYIDNGYCVSMLYYNGTAWSQVGGDQMGDVVTDNAWLSYANRTLSFNFSTNDRIANIIIQKGTER
jgi:hypothetical protein